MAQRGYDQVTPYAGRATHEKFLAAHAHAWQLSLSDTQGGGALLQALTFPHNFLPLVPLTPLPTLWNMANGNSDPPHGRKLSTEREI